MRTLYTIAAHWSWVVVVLVWLPGAFAVKRNAKTAQPGRQIATGLLALIGFALLLDPRLFPPFDIGATPQTPFFGPIGLVLDVVGVGFAIWARVVLGRNWSGAVVSLKEGHELVQSGPYAVVRHPIYAGFLLAALGTALTMGRLGSYLGVAVILATFLLRVAAEEALMRQQFPSAHEDYCRRTRKLVPFLW